jgi:O-antigen/teichoic acid export membrane protein
MSLFKRLNPLAAVADQAWLSLLSFAVSLAFIWGASKAEYGYYLLLIAPLLLVQSIQNALINSPLATFLPAADESEKQRIRTTAVSMHIYLALAGAVLGLLGLLVYGSLAHFQTGGLLVAGFTLAIIGTIARESQRSFAYVHGQGVLALTGDLIYGGGLLLGIGLAIADNSLSAGIVLVFTGIAGIAPLLVKLGKFQGLQTHAGPIKQFWSCGRWALPSVIVTWINLSSYPYFAGKALGVSAVADIGAARLFLMPIGLMMTAWANWYRPRISRWFACGDIGAIKRLTHTSLLAGLAIMALLAMFFFVAYPLLERFLGPQYQGLQPVVLMWLLYFSISLARNFYMATLMIDAEGYKILHHITWLALALSLPGFILFSANGATWIVGVLCAVELMQVLMVVIKARQYWKRPQAET